MTASVKADVIPVADFLTLGERPHLTGFRCPECGAVYLLRRSGCSRCGGDALGDREDLGDSGMVTAATVVHRAPAGVASPITKIWACVNAVEPPISWTPVLRGEAARHR